MLNFKTFIKTVYRNSRYFYQDFVNGYNVFTDGKIMVFIDSDDGKITWFASRLLACISKRYKGGKEVVKNTPTIKHETFRVYYKGDEDLFVVILPVCALDNDGVVFRK